MGSGSSTYQRKLISNEEKVMLAETKSILTEILMSTENLLVSQVQDLEIEIVVLFVSEYQDIPFTKQRFRELVNDCGIKCTDIKYKGTRIYIYTEYLIHEIYGIANKRLNPMRILMVKYVDVYDKT